VHAQWCADPLLGGDARSLDHPLAWLALASDHPAHRHLLVEVAPIGGSQRAALIKGSDHVAIF
jgi:hypothetical protein